MGVKIVTTRTEVTEVDTDGEPVQVNQSKSCGPVCKTVKTVATVGAAALVLGALAGK